jgi:M6 family metalloprotease-like protein
VSQYYSEISGGAFHLKGRVFDWIEVSRKRAEYAQGTNASDRSIFFTEALDRLRDREGATVLEDFDGLLFLHAGDRVNTANRGSLYWPHQGNTPYRGARWAYFICPEGGRRMADISTACHEFGHSLGLPDLYARPENPGSEGLGIWCCMSNESGRGRPQHFGAWCKEQLGWLKPALIDPAVKQKLILAPIEGSTNECFKVLVRPDGSEYLLLENRRHIGFDRSLPGEGLLIWRVVNGKPILEESHGIDGPAGPRLFPSAVPYPSRANNAFTPYTTPSSRSLLGGGTPVHITNIRELADGRITFQIGYEFE